MGASIKYVRAGGGIHRIASCWPRGFVANKSNNARQRRLFTCLLLNLCSNLPQNLEANGTQFGVVLELSKGG